MARLTKSTGRRLMATGHVYVSAVPVEMPRNSYRAHGGFAVKLHADAGEIYGIAMDRTEAIGVVTSLARMILESGDATGRSILGSEEQALLAMIQEGLR